MISAVNTLYARRNGLLLFKISDCNETLEYSFSLYKSAKNFRTFLSYLKKNRKRLVLVVKKPMGHQKVFLGKN